MGYYLYKAKGIARIGLTFWKAKDHFLSSLVIERDNIRLRKFFRTINIAKKDIYYIEPFKKGIRIVSDLHSYPFISFTPYKKIDLTDILKKSGYKVKIEH